MSEVITNMKVRFGADTKQFKKGMNDGKKSVQTFKKDAGSAMESFANQFGVSLGPLSGVLNKATTATKGLSASMKSASASTNIFTKSLKLFKVALISTGIGALLVAVGALVSYFTNTQRGADKVSKVFKSLGAITSVLVDRFSVLGEGIVKAFENPQEAIKNLWESIKTNIVNRFTGIISLFQTVGDGMKALWSRDWDALKDAATQATQDIIQVTSGLDGEQQKKFGESIKGVATEIKEEAKAAYELEAARQKLDRREIEFIKTKQRLKQEISELILKSRDEKIAAEERLEYVEKAQKLQAQLSAEEIAIAEQRASILKKQQALGENMIEDDRQLAQAEADVNQMRKEGNDKMRELVNRYTEMTNKITANTKAIKAQREELTAFISEPIESKTLEVNVDTSKLETDKLTASLSKDLGEAQAIVADFSAAFETALEDLAVDFGVFLGNLITGEADFGDFGKVILSSLGDLAVSVGTMAIQFGVTMAALKKSFSNPYVAVGAGIALVALGTAIKSQMEGSSSGSMSSYSGYSDYTPRSSTSTSVSNAQAINLNITGELKGRGTELVAVLSETSKRSSYAG